MSNEPQDTTDVAVVKAEEAAVAALEPDSPAWVVARRQVYEYCIGVGKAFYSAGMVPKSHKSALQTGLIILAGRRYGLDEQLSIANIHLIDGKTGLSSSLLGGLARKNGITFEYEHGEGWCKVTGTRSDTGETYTAEWDSKKAARAGLDKKDNWRKYEIMLLWRAQGEVVRVLGSDSELSSVYHISELEDAQEKAAEPEEPAESRTDALKAELGALVEAVVPEAEPQADEPEPTAEPEHSAIFEQFQKLVSEHPKLANEACQAQAGVAPSEVTNAYKKGEVSDAELSVIAMDIEAELATAQDG